MPLKWRKVLIADERYEACSVFDVNGDGVLDIVSGAWWYEGPDFKIRHAVGEVAAVGEYYDDFGSIPLDVTGNGRLDYVTGAWWSRSHVPLPPWGSMDTSLRRILIQIRR